MKPLYPHDYPTTTYEIETKHKWIDFIYEKIQNDECHRTEGDADNVGYVMLDNDEIQETFQPIFNKLQLNVKVISCYIHYTAKNGSFAVHRHDQPHAVYYLQAPMNSGPLYFPDFGEYFPPEPDRFRFIPENIMHGIGKHENDIERIAITMQFEYI